MEGVFAGPGARPILTIECTIVSSVIGPSLAGKNPVRPGPRGHTNLPLGRPQRCSGSRLLRGTCSGRIVVLLEVDYLEFDLAREHFPLPGLMLLVDCGGSVTMRLLKMEILHTVTDVLITHLHSDHIGSLESLAFFAYYALGKHDDNNKLQLHVATDEFAHRLWENSLKGGMEPIVDYDLTVKDSTLETFFDVHVGKTVNIEGLPTVEFCPTVHIAGMENYGLMIDDRVYYSGDTIEKPSQKADTVFHDCEFRDPATPGVHITYDELLDAIPKNERAKYYLTHVGANADPQAVLVAGFGGVAEPGQRFEFDESGPPRIGD